MLTAEEFFYLQNVEASFYDYDHAGGSEAVYKQVQVIELMKSYSEYVQNYNQQQQLIQIKK